jgi:hypothetical protein
VLVGTLVAAAACLLVLRQLPRIAQALEKA